MNIKYTIVIDKYKGLVNYVSRLNGKSVILLLIIYIYYLLILFKYIRNLILLFLFFLYLLKPRRKVLFSKT